MRGGWGVHFPVLGQTQKSSMCQIHEQIYTLRGKSMGRYCTWALVKNSMCQFHVKSHTFGGRSMGSYNPWVKVTKTSVKIKTPTCFAWGQVKLVKR